MKNSAVGRAQDFLAKAQDSGLTQEIDDRLELRDHERRLELIEELKNLPTEVQTGLPSLAKEAGQALRELELAEEAYRRADKNYKALSLRAHATQNQFYGKRELMREEIATLAPEHLKVARIQLDNLRGSVRNEIQVWHEYGWEPFGGKFQFQKSNRSDLDAMMAEIDAARNRIEAMLLEALSPEKMKIEAVEICKKIHKRSVELGLRTRAFDEYVASIDQSFLRKATGKIASVFGDA